MVILMRMATHKIFGEMVLRQYNIPLDLKLINWAVLPDKRYGYDSFFQSVLLHRWSFHGIENIPAAIEEGKRSDLVTYSEELKSLIWCLLMSHSYLDLFNFILHPSRPNKFTFTWIPNQLHRFFTLQTVKEPDGTLNVLQSMLDQTPHYKDLSYLMLTEYRNLPSIGVWMKEILSLYNKETKNVEELSN